MKTEEIINKYVQKAFDESDNQQYFNTYACAKHFKAGLNHASEVNAKLKEQLAAKDKELSEVNERNDYLKSKLHEHLNSCEFYTVDTQLMKDIIYLLDYFNKGLSDVKAGSGEEQPNLSEIKSALIKLKELTPTSKR